MCPKNNNNNSIVRYDCSRIKENKIKICSSVREIVTSFIFEFKTVFAILIYEKEQINKQKWEKDENLAAFLIICLVVFCESSEKTVGIFTPRLWSVGSEQTEIFVRYKTPCCILT